MQAATLEALAKCVQEGEAVVATEEARQVRILKCLQTAYNTFRRKCGTKSAI